MRNNMTTKQVIHALHLHQKWRRGAISEMPLTAKEYGQALDEAIRLLRQYDKQQDGAVRCVPEVRQGQMPEILF